ncbi:STAS domain-containing protein [Candidatus Peregrinibacteria bacterium]|nr:STAS domain-containing protein [Candidatus Peregrinibacteria bacterium]
MAQVNISFQDIDQAGKMIKLIGFEGQLDETNVDSEAKKIYQVITEMAEPNILLDFAGLEYMNSKSIGYLTDWYSQVTAKNGKIVIARPRANILDILKVVGITQIIDTLENLDEAKAAFSGAAPSEATPAPAAETPVAAASQQAPVNQAPTTPPTA